MIPPKGPREWALLGRPLGEWVFLTVIAMVGLNAIREGLTNDFHGARQLSVQAGQSRVSFL